MSHTASRSLLHWSRSCVQRLSTWFRLRINLLLLRLDRLATVLFASAASFIGVDALLALLGVTVSFPIAFPAVILGLALLAAIRPLLSRGWRMVRRRRSRAPLSVWDGSFSDET